MPAWARITPGVGKFARQLHRVQAERGDAPTGVDQHRQGVLVGQGHERPHLRVVERERPARGMELDAARAGLQASLGFGHRPVVWVHAAERDEQPAGWAAASSTASFAGG